MKRKKAAVLILAAALLCPACQRSGRRGAGRNDRCQPDRSSPGWSLGSLV